MATTDPTTAVARRRLLVIFNPVAGRRRRGRFAAVLERLRALGCAVRVLETAGRGDAERIARELEAGLFDAVVAAGGDGTVNEVANGLAGRHIPLAFLPLGTANILAHELGLALTPDAIAGCIAGGPVLPIAVGRANDRIFTIMAGVGFDAHVVRAVGERSKRQLGQGAYVLESLHQLVGFRFPRYRVRIGGRLYEAASVIVANGCCYGGRYVCAPEARLEAPTLEVVLLRDGDRRHVAAYAVAIATGRLHRRDDVTVVRATALTIEGPPGDPVQADGDILVALPVRIDVLPRALPLVVPPGYPAAAELPAARSAGTGAP
jgi:diacylglycerol kinase (ATP)